MVPDARHMNKVRRILGDAPRALTAAEILAHPEVRMTGPYLGLVLDALEKARRVERCVIATGEGERAGYFIGPNCREPRADL